MNVLIVHAHHEPESFSSALATQARETLQAQGHDVVCSDLYAMGFDPVSDRRNFTTTKNPGYLKQQSEEVYASSNDGFAEDIELEIRKLEAADAVLFSFPLWWFSMPAIMKGWCDRVLAAGRVYGGPKLYENGIGAGMKRGLILMTTGGGPTAYDGWGVNPQMNQILAPIQHGVFWFNGIVPLEPFIAWSPARIESEDRLGYLRALDRRLKELFDESGQEMPRLEDFPDFGPDTQTRFMVTVDQVRERDDVFMSRVPAEIDLLAQLRRRGNLIDTKVARSDELPWRAFLHFRAVDRAEVEGWIEQSPLAEYFEFTVTELDRPSDG